MAITFATYYTHTKTVTKSFPQFTIETIEGDEAYIKNVMISGDLYSFYTSNDPFQITKEGTTYLRDENYLSRMHLYYQSPTIKKLQKEYRSFMRGKEEFLDNFYETNDKLVYAQIAANRLGLPSGNVDIEILNKETNETTTYSFPLEVEGDDYNFISKVIASDDEVYIIVQQDVFNDTGEINKVNAVIYTFSPEQNKVVSNVVIPLYEGNEYMDFFKVLVANENGLPKKILLSATRSEYVNADGKKIEEESFNENEELFDIAHTKKIFLFDTETKAYEEISLENEKYIGAPIGFDEQNVSFINVENKELTLKMYDLIEQKVTSEKRVPTNLEHAPLWSLLQGVTKDHLYYTFIVADDNKSGFVYVIDTDSNEILYEGKITSEESKAISQMEIGINTIELTD